jgi:hypothetical protein
MLYRYTSPNYDLERMWSLPVMVPQLGISGWRFMVGGFLFLAKIDSRTWPDLPVEVHRECVVNGKDHLSGVFAPFERSLEHDEILRMARAEFAKIQKRRKNSTGPGG